MIPYTRVLPRDLFNEANLLKCLGKLSLDIHDGILSTLELVHTRENRGFDIYQDETDGSIICDNINFRTKEGMDIWMHRPLNSRAPWPLIATLENVDDETIVFDDNGNYTPEFLELIGL